MRIDITYRGTSETEAIKTKINEQFAKFDRFLRPEDVVGVTVSVKDNGHLHKVETTVHQGKKVLHAEACHEDLYVAIDKLEEKMLRVLRKNKEKYETQKTRDAQAVRYENVEIGEPAAEPVIVKTKTYKIEPMSVEEACVELDLTGHPFYLFRDEHTGNVNLVYLRNDGNYGVIETE